MKYIFIGDVHGNLNNCLNVSTANPTSTIVQIGDYGVGFIPFDVFLRLPENFKFFPGNHDQRQLCHKLPHCLGDYGEVNNHFFFVSGADSIDKRNRIEGVSWWDDEELTYKQAEDCLVKWEKSKVDVLVTHDAPQSFVEKYMLMYDRCLTRDLIQTMIEVRKPNILISGHHHKKIRLTHNDILWVSLGIDEQLSLDIF